MDDNVAVNTPLAFVVPEMGAKVLADPLADRVTAVPAATGLPSASLTVTVSVVSDTPLAVSDAGLAAMVDVAADGGPATTAAVAALVTDVVLLSGSFEVATTRMLAPSSAS